MELDLQRTTLEGYQRTVDVILSQEETLDSIVPDSFPDISRVISASGTACLSAKQLNRGSLKVMGTVNVCVLYMPENDTCPRSLWIKIPFQCVGDDPKIKDTDHFHTTVLSVTADARMLNPRKLFVKAELKLSAKVYAHFKNEVVGDLAAEECGSVQKMWCETQHYAIAAVLEKQFLFSDTLRHSQSKPQIEELLSYCITPTSVEARYIGKKLVCKGEMTLSALYRTGADLSTVRFELPFSQVLDFESAFDEGEPEVSVYLKSTECILRDGELDVSVEAALQTSLWAHKTVALLSDIYSTAVPLNVERASGVFCTSRECETRRETARKFCESGIPAKQVLECSAFLTPATLQKSGTSVECSTDGVVNILYLSEDNALCAVEYKIPVKCSLDIGEEFHCDCSCVLVGEAVAVPVTGGFEARIEIEFFWSIFRSEKRHFVSKAEQSKETAEPEPGPSVIIRMVGRGESLWDIAKSCRSTISDICTANELNAESAEPGTILLIPTKR